MTQFTVEPMTAQELGDYLGRVPRRPPPPEVPFLKSDDQDRWFRDPETRGLYWVARDAAGRLAGVFKFYRDQGEPARANEWLAGQGLPPIRGRVYSGAYIGVAPEYRRQGLATRLNDAMLDALRPGDVFRLGTHEPDGRGLNRAWLAARSGRVHVLYGNRYTAYQDYDPARVNYVVTDERDFGRVARPERVAARFSR